MKFMLLLNVPRGSGEYDLWSWSEKDLQAHMAFLKRFNEELKEDGTFVSVEGLTPPKQARLVRAGKGGKPEVTDGPFAESKEFLAGYWIIDVETREQAYAIAGRASAAPGPNGQPLNILIEVREVMSGMPVEP